jgi:hypothetical protein
MSPEARDHSFDELTRGLASGSISRGKALKLMGAALVGGTLASIPGIAGAAPKPKCPDCPAEQCSCVKDLGNSGQRACISNVGISPIRTGDCSACVPDGLVCVRRTRDFEGNKAVLCSPPCITTPGNFVDCQCVGGSVRGTCTADCSTADAFCNTQCADLGGGVPISCVPNSFC